YILYSLSFFFFYVSVSHRDLHSFPTRRSSDLGLIRPAMLTRGNDPDEFALLLDARGDVLAVTGGTCRSAEQHGGRRRDHHPLHRSEEHTSELQSRGHLVCRLLLEKKKKTTQQY